MESSGSMRMGKRGYERGLELDDDAEDHHPPEPKKQRLPALASVIVESLKVDSLQRLSSSLEPLLRRIVSEEVERALTKLDRAELVGRSLPPRIQGPEGKTLQLQFKTRMPPHLFTGAKVEGEQGAAIHVVLIDLSTGSVLRTGAESAAKLNVVVLEGDFNDEADDSWTKEHFENHEVKEREGKGPLLTGDLQVILKEGVGTLGDLTFTDNSSWKRSRKFRLGVKLSPGYCDGARICEAKTDAFTVKDHRGELYKKHYPPALHDEVWRLDRIAKDGALHKKLIKAEIVSVEDFLRLLVKDPQKLRSMLGSGMSNRMWENTVEHAKTCVLGGKLYVYYTDRTHSTGIVFNHIYELRGLIADGQFLALESLTHSQKVSVDSLVKRAYDNWHQVIEYDGKFLHSLAGNQKEARAAAAPIADHAADHKNYAIDHHSAATQNRQPFTSQYGQQFQTENNRPSVPQFIEFPFVRSDQTALIKFNNREPAALSGSMGYMPSVGGSHFSGDWSRPNYGNGLDDFVADEIRIRSSEMLESDDMQRLLKTFSMGVGVAQGASFGSSDEACYNYSVPYEQQIRQPFRKEHAEKSSGKAVVGWLKLKAALRWGIFIRKIAAERRAQLRELD